MITIKIESPEQEAMRSALVAGRNTVMQRLKSTKNPITINKLKKELNLIRKWLDQVDT